jgi:hypothetical protein
MPRLVEIFHRDAELVLMASVMVQDGKLPHSVVSAFHCSCPSQVSFGELSDQQGVASVQQPEIFGVLQCEDGAASYFCEWWWV